MYDVSQTTKDFCVYSKQTNFHHHKEPRLNSVKDLILSGISSDVITLVNFNMYKKWREKKKHRLKDWLTFHLCPKPRLPVAPCFLKLGGRGWKGFSMESHCRTAATEFGFQLGFVTVKPWEQNCKTLAWTHY